MRVLLNMRCTEGIITNKDLYKRCNSVKLSERVPKARWKLLGHILRSADDSPAALALKFAVTTQCRGRVGAHRKNLFKTIENDLALRGFKNFKFNSLSTYLHKIPDRPPVSGYSCATSNSVLEWC